MPGRLVSRDNIELRLSSLNRCAAARIYRCLAMYVSLLVSWWCSVNTALAPLPRWLRACPAPGFAEKRDVMRAVSQTVALWTLISISGSPGPSPMQNDLEPCVIPSTWPARSPPPTVSQNRQTPGTIIDGTGKSASGASGCSAAPTNPTGATMMRAGADQFGVLSRHI